MVQRRRRGNYHGPRSSHSRRPISYKVLCSGCGKEVVTQVSPPSGKKLLCTECFNKAEISPEITPVLL